MLATFRDDAVDGVDFFLPSGSTLVEDFVKRFLPLFRIISLQGQPNILLSKIQRTEYAYYLILK